MATTDVRTRAHALYRFYDTADVLLYVGITCNPPRRFEKHAAEKEWWQEVARVEIEHFPDRASVLIAERTAIGTEKPRHNIRMANGNGESPAVPAPADDGADGLVGRYFHSWREPSDEDSQYATVRGGRVLEWQGHVIERVELSLYLIELFSWWDGTPNGAQLADVAEMRAWTFYESALEMQAALGCREQWPGANGDCGRECTHVAWAIGITTVCSHCVDSYSVSAEIVWRPSDLHPDEKATLEALRWAKKKAGA